MKDLSPNTELIAKCGLYCGGCKKYQKGNCGGCDANAKATWCKIRSCCIDKQISSCANCDEYENTKECTKHKGFVIDIFSFVFNSDRHACVAYIKKNGVENFAELMADKNWVTMPLRGKKKIQ